jgi:acetyl/propionyl-CoA carboxylase alpha subunit
MHPEFISGDYDTHFIPRHQESLLEPEAEEADKMEAIALATAAIIQFTRKDTQNIADPTAAQPKTSAWKLSGRMNNPGSMI